MERVYIEYNTGPYHDHQISLSAIYKSIHKERIVQEIQNKNKGHNSDQYYLDEPEMVHHISHEQIENLGNTIGSDTYVYVIARNLGEKEYPFIIDLNTEKVELEVLHLYTFDSDEDAWKFFQYWKQDRIDSIIGKIKISI